MTPNALRAAEILLDFIGKVETGREGVEAYNTVYGHREGKLGKALTDFTLDELVAAQRTWGKNWGSSAAGKFQIIRKTLLGLMGALELAGSARFSKATQDMLGLKLLKDRGFEQFVAGTLPLKAFGLNLAKEWASMPVLAPTQGASRQVDRGQSYYAGDGLNKALVPPGDLEAVLSEVLNRAVTDPSKPLPRPASEQPPAAPEPAPELPRTGKGWRISGWTILGILLAAALLIAAFTIRF